MITTYVQAMTKIQHLLDCHGWEKSRDDASLKIKWRVKTMQDGQTLTFWFKSQAIYFTLNHNAVRHFKDARSMHMDNIKEMAQISTFNPAHVYDYLIKTAYVLGKDV